MSFANPLPWWALALVVISAGLVAWLAYSRRTLPPLRRGVLVALRFVTLLALVVFVLRPVVSGTDAGARDAVVAILVDMSRSMSIEDAGGGVVGREPVLDREGASALSQRRPLEGCPSLPALEPGCLVCLAALPREKRQHHAAGGQDGLGIKIGRSLGMGAARQLRLPVQRQLPLPV